MFPRKPRKPPSVAQSTWHQIEMAERRMRRAMRDCNRRLVQIREALSPTSRRLLEISESLNAPPPTGPSIVESDPLVPGDYDTEPARYAVYEGGNCDGILVTYAPTQGTAMRLAEEYSRVHKVLMCVYPIDAQGDPIGSGAILKEST